MELLRHDLRFAVRTLLKKPAFTAIVVFTLALGIGANAAIFSVVNAVILQPLPFYEPDRLVHIWEGGSNAHYTRGEDSRFISVRPGTFHDWRQQSSSFSELSAYSWRSVTLNLGDKADALWAQHVADRFFETLGVRAQLGRFFRPEDYGPGAQPVVILSYGLWNARFAGDPAIIGRTISLDNQTYTVVGVAPPGFFPTRFNRPDLWTARWFDAEEKNNRVAWGLTTIARLKPGVTFEQAQAEMRAVAKNIERSYPEHYQNMGAVLVPVDAEIIGSLGRLFFLLLCAVSLVLLIACVNVANLMLVRATEREREFAVRTALGASRWRIMRQLLTESLLLAALGGGLGLLFASVGLRSLLTLVPAAANAPRLDEVGLNWRAFAFTAAVSFLTGIIFGLAPAFRAARTDLNENLKESGRGNAMGARRKRLSKTLVVGEIAVSLALLAVAGLLTQSFVRLLRTDPGFAASKLLTMEIRPPDFRYGKYETGGKNLSRAQLYEQLVQRLSALPGVESAGIASKLPVKHGPNPWGISIEGRPAPPSSGQEAGSAIHRKAGLYFHGSVAINRVTPEFPRTLGLRLLRGRLLDERDTVEKPMVAMISETTARKYWPNEDPIGKRFTVDYTSWFPQMQIVGVVADIKTDSYEKPPYPEIYWPMTQAPSATGRLLIRTKTDPEILAAAAREEIAAIDRGLPILDVRAMEGVIADTLWRARLAAWLLGLFAALAISLTAAGLYGVLAYSVSQRTQELGLRMALGAAPRRVLGQVIGEGMRLAVVGLAIGLAASLALSRFIASQLYGVRSTDPLTFAGVTLLLAGVAFLACFVPARRASKTDPMVALRHE